MDYHSFTDSEGWKTELAKLADQTWRLESLATKSPVNHRTGAGQEKVFRPKTDILPTALHHQLFLNNAILPKLGNCEKVANFS